MQSRIDLVSTFLLGRLGLLRVGFGAWCERCHLESGADDSNGPPSLLDEPDSTSRLVRAALTIQGLLEKLNKCGDELMLQSPLVLCVQ
jgi:hypothetical protein